ncbi:ABC transporter permease [Aliidongia dinghuensis]|uniref:ABC transporter permease n=1 Tax=Aliidongia dinghuensis TaxID=1867774 RepID=A0A8J2YRP0_9PROT|nr:DMT family transporter [Aliidongia dinghuensis]GGF08551.1 ABC transporter permease [Aliidongia dinghuensis]
MDGEGRGRERWGIAAAAASSLIGGLSLVAIRRVVGTTDPVLLAFFRYGIGALCLLPLSLRGRERLPPPRAWPEIVLLGGLFFALFPILLNQALVDTTASRGALALSSLPLLTLVIAATAGAERLTGRKLAGILLACAGVALALAGQGFGAQGLSTHGLSTGHWRGDLTMVAAALIGALYNVLARPAIRRHGALGFTALAMAAGAVTLMLLVPFGGPLSARLPQDGLGWGAVGFLGLVGGALTFLLWSAGLARTTPTRVAVTVALNPVSAMLVGAFWLGEPIGPALLGGLGAVTLGILVASR